MKNIKKSFNYRLATYNETKQNRWNRFCPHCGRADFSPYINIHTGEPVDEKVCGKCDHNSSCGYHMPPREWWAKYGSGQATKHQYTLEEIAEVENRCKMTDPGFYNRDSREEVMKQYTNLNFFRQVQSVSEAARYERCSFKRQHPSVQAYLKRMEAWCEESQSGDNTLNRYLYKLFLKERVDAALKRYRVGNTENGHIIYWQIDEMNHVHTGKVMAYGHDGHRKKGRGAFNWVHTAKGEEMFIGQCLFGEHLLSEMTTLGPIGLVESEKTALIMSILMPDVAWMATGGKQNFNLKMLAPIINHDVMVLPDTDAIIEWSSKLKEWFGEESSFTIPEWYISLCEDPRVRGMKWDVADMLLMKLNDGLSIVE